LTDPSPKTIQSIDLNSNVQERTEEISEELLRREEIKKKLKKRAAEKFDSTFPKKKRRLFV
jgi:hypothetical protein